MEAITSFFSPELIWFLIGLVFILLEFLIPGVIVIFFGIGAWLTALALLFFNFGINAQLVIFLTASIVFLVILRKKVKNIFVGDSENQTPDDLDNITGKKVKVIKAISPNENGKVMFNGSTWNAESQEAIEENEIVQIIGKKNLTLIVEKLTKE
jgi:membrane protein implicated in regulation of membrane protease activity